MGGFGIGFGFEVVSPLLLPRGVGVPLSNGRSFEPKIPSANLGSSGIGRSTLLPDIPTEPSASGESGSCAIGGPALTPAIASSNGLFDYPDDDDFATTVDEEVFASVCGSRTALRDLGLLSRSGSVAGSDRVVGANGDEDDVAFVLVVTRDSIRRISPG